jgi:hypothetical protein
MSVKRYSSKNIGQRYLRSRSFSLKAFHRNAPFYPCCLTALYEDSNSESQELYVADVDENSEIIDFKKIKYDELNIATPPRSVLNEYSKTYCGDIDIVGLLFGGERLICGRGFKELAPLALRYGSDAELLSNPIFSLSLARLAKDSKKEIHFTEAAVRQMGCINPQLAQRWLISTNISDGARAAATNILEGMKSFQGYHFARTEQMSTFMQIPNIIITPFMSSNRRIQYFELYVELNFRIVDVSESNYFGFNFAYLFLNTENTIARGYTNLNPNIYRERGISVESIDSAGGNVWRVAADKGPLRGYYYFDRPLIKLKELSVGSEITLELRAPAREVVASSLSPSLSPKYANKVALKLLESENIQLRNDGWITLARQSLTIRSNRKY